MLPFPGLCCMWLHARITFPPPEMSISNEYLATPDAAMYCPRRKIVCAAKSSSSSKSAKPCFSMNAFPAAMLHRPNSEVALLCTAADSPAQVYLLKTIMLPSMSGYFPGSSSTTERFAAFEQTNRRTINESAPLTRCSHQDKGQTTHHQRNSGVIVRQLAHFVPVPASFGLLPFAPGDGCRERAAHTVHATRQPGTNVLRSSREIFLQNVHRLLRIEVAAIKRRISDDLTTGQPAPAYRLSAKRITRARSMRTAGYSLFISACGRPVSNRLSDGNRHANRSPNGSPGFPRRTRRRP